jgi:hypothetical protein
MVCKEPNFDVELHHTTYDRLGCEKLTDLVPLCREHHELVHQYLDARCLGKVEDTGRVVRALTRKNGKRKITGSKRTNRHIPDNKRGTGRKNTGYTPETEPLSDN